MEEGSLRAEPNISLRPKGSSELGVKTEIKNVASFSGVQKAIEFEIKRQSKVLREGGKVVQETRGWNADRGTTESQRAKESAHDYRYFPEPDLVPIVVDAAWEGRIREKLPELPRARMLRFKEQYALSEYDADVLTAEMATANFFEETVRAGAQPKPAANWIMVELRALLDDSGRSISDCVLSPKQLASLLGLIGAGTISGKIAKEVLAEAYASGKDPAAIVNEKGLTQISDTSALETAIREVLQQHPGPVEDVRGGKAKAKGFLVGQVMKATQGKGNPKMVNELLDKLLAER
jgi:aspartyl-tRNA(Asn)/glutamyl-tRNA(Gln) amidotransferase subunit B